MTLDDQPRADWLCCVGAMCPQADDDPERFKERLGKLVKQKPADKGE